MERYTRCLLDDSSNLVSAVLLSTVVSQLADSGQHHLCTGQVLLAAVGPVQVGRLVGFVVCAAS